MSLDLICQACGREFVAVLKSERGVRCPNCRKKVYVGPHNSRVHVIGTPTSGLRFGMLLKVK